MIAHLASWRESAMFSPAEQAALSYCEGLTSFDHREFPALHENLRAHFTETEVAEIAAVVGQAVDIGIGLHAGPVVIGEIGHASGMAIDIIGETVNTAARLEALTKEERCQIIVSTEVLHLAGLDLPRLGRKIVHIRGIDAPMVIVPIPAGREIDFSEAAPTAVTTA